MKGRLYIDGRDAYAEFGVYVIQGGWNELIAYPPLKPVESNDWQEEDGIEADLSSPVLNTREVSLRIAFGGLDNRLLELLELLSDGAYHMFDCRHIGRMYKLRLVSMPNLTITERIGTVTLKLADDFPLDNYVYNAPSCAAAPNADYTLDGRKFTDYGVRVLQGALEEVVKTPSVKDNLLRNINTQQGAWYDGKAVVYKAKDIKISCLMRATTLTELWRNYDALLYDLIRPSERVLGVEELGAEYPFHYKSCQVVEFYPMDKIWLKFTLTITVTRNFRVQPNATLLANEEGIFICTEDGESGIEIKIK